MLKLRAMYVMIAVLLFLSPYQTQPHVSSKKTSVNAGAAQQKTSEPHKHPPNSGGTSIGECFNCFDVPTPGASNKQHDPYDASKDSLYRAYLIFAICGVPIALIGIIVLICQTIITRKAANAADRSARAAELTAERFAQIEGGRITVTIDWTTGVGKKSFHEDGTMHLLIDVFFKNDGKSSAWIKQIRLNAQMFENTIPAEPDFQNIPIIYDGIKILEPTQEYRQHETPLVKKDGFGKWIIVWGAVEFGDTFSDDKESTFGYIATIDDKLQRLSGAAYNKQTQRKNPP
jgi:hypothetical protein